MSLRSSLRPLLLRLMETVGRFPLPLLACCTFCVVTVARNHHWLSSLIDGDATVRTQYVAVLAFFWALAARLVSESREWGVAREWVFALVGLALITLKVLFDQPAFQFGNETMLFLGPALLLLMLSAPFLSRLGDTEAFWEFNRTALLGAALAFLAALILAAGLSLALAAIEELFGLDISGTYYEDIWILALGLFCPWLALSRVPSGFDATEGASCPRPLALLIAFVLMPLAIAYLLIVYAYVARILVLWELPSGQVGPIVGGYAGFGVATFLVSWPLRETGPIHVRLFLRFFPLALVVPIILLAVAVAERVSAYGITEPRYALILVALWLACLTALLLFDKVGRVAALPLIFAAMLLVGSFGPWGAADASLRSQVGRLQSALEEAGRFADGRVTESDAVVIAKQETIGSIVRYLGRSDRLDAVTSWFGPDTLPADPHYADVLSAISPDTSWHQSRRRSYSYAGPVSLPVAEYDLILLPGDLTSSAGSGEFRLPDGQEMRWGFSSNIGVLRIRDRARERAAFDLASLADGMRQRYGEDWTEWASSEDMTLEEQVGGHRIRLVVRRLAGNTGTPTNFWEADVVLLIAGAGPSNAPD